MGNTLTSNNITYSKTKRCPICGKPYIRVERQRPAFVKNKPPVYDEYPSCDCEKKKREQERIEKCKKLRQEKIIKNFNNILMGPYLRTITFDKYKATEQLKFCKKYTQQFQPKISKGLQLIGNPGTGKTTLLAAICNELMQRHVVCLLIQLSTLLDIFTDYSGKNSGNATVLLNLLTKIDFIALDDIGRETYTEKRLEHFFNIINTLMLSDVTVCISANQDRIERLMSINGMDAAIDRLKELCPTVIEFKGESFRGKS